MCTWGPIVEFPYPCACNGECINFKVDIALAPVFGDAAADVGTEFKRSVALVSFRDSPSEQTMSCQLFDGKCTF